MVNILMSNMSLDRKWCRLELRKYIKPSSRVTIMGFQFYEENLRSAEHWDEFYDKKTGAAYSYLTKPFEFFGVAAKTIKWVNYFKDTPASAKRKIKSSDVLIFTGGIAPLMVKIIDDLELRETIESYKGVIIGFGAGALIQTSEYKLRGKDFKGLALTDVNIHISFDELDLEDEDFSEEAVYAITDDGALVVENGEVSTLGDVYFAENGTLRI